MNVRTKLTIMLVDMGMFESQAEKVMDIVELELDEIVMEYHITWDAEYNSYPKGIYSVFMSAIKPIALKWINENMPEAWYKPMFEN